MDVAFQTNKHIYCTVKFLFSIHICIWLGPLNVFNLPQTSAQTSSIESRSLWEGPGIPFMLLHSYHISLLFILTAAVKIARKVGEQHGATHEWFVHLKVIFLVKLGI